VPTASPQQAGNRRRLGRVAARREWHEMNGLTGFSAEELDELLALIGDGDGLANEDVISEPSANLVSRPGSLAARRRDRRTTWRAARRHQAQPDGHLPTVWRELRSDLTPRRRVSATARMEIEPRYCDVIVERWQNLTGKRPRSTATAARSTSQHCPLLVGWLKAANCHRRSAGRSRLR
jgi:hypothetical protein